MILYTIAAIIFLNGFRTATIRDSIVLSWTISMSALGLAISASRPPEYVHGASLLVASVAIFFFLIHNRWLFQLIPMFVTSAGTIVILVVVKKGVSGASLFSMILAFLIVNATGILASWRLHHYRRAQFFATRELEVALANVKTLSGMIPICAGCKQIRDDQGFWQAVEKYVMDRSDARFSHGYCPACFELAMAEVDALPKRQG
ncbi:MAG: hypothetical protein AAB353_01835 [Candidatus Hydrogenedentota bacterium]